MSIVVANLLKQKSPAAEICRIIATGLVVLPLTIFAGWSAGPGGDGRDRPAAMSSSQLATVPHVDLLAGTWRYMPGVRIDGHHLQIHATDEKVLSFADNSNPKSASTSYQANPPVNLYGTHLQLDQNNDVAIAARLSSIQHDATLSFHRAPPTHLDEKVITQPGVDVTVADGMVTFRFLAKAGNAASVTRFAIPKYGTTADILLAQQDGAVTVTVNGHSRTLRAAPLDGQVWFGADTTGSFTVSSLQAYSLGGNHVRSIDGSTQTAKNVRRAPTGLYGTAEAHGHASKRIGTAVDLGQLVSNPAYADFIARNYNSITPESVAKFQNLQPRDGQFEWGELDALVDFASEHDMRIHGHALVFGEAYPQWLEQKLAHSDRQQSIQILRQWIVPVLERYKGKIPAWDVINEPQSSRNYGSLSHDIWYDAIGPDYPVVAARIVHSTDPDAEIWINEYAMEIDDTMLQAVLDQADAIRQGGVPANKLGVGFQSHLYEDDLEDSVAMQKLQTGGPAQKFKQVGARGYTVRISELSVAENTSPQRQAALYGVLGRACMQAANCDGVTVWGPINTEYQNRYAYFTSDSLSDPGDDAMISQTPSGLLVPRPAFKTFKQSISAR